MLPYNGAGFLGQLTAPMTCVCRCDERGCAATQAPAATAPAAFSGSPVLVCGETCCLAMARFYDLYMAGALTGVCCRAGTRRNGSHGSAVLLRGGDCTAGRRHGGRQQWLARVGQRGAQAPPGRLAAGVDLTLALPYPIILYKSSYGTGSCIHSHKATAMRTRLAASS